MKASKISLFIVLAMFFIGGKLKSQTVYMTDNGKKYHTKNCDVAKTGKKGITIEEAKKKGLEPCKVCKVDESGKAKDKKTDVSKENATTEKSKKGNKSAAKTESK